jgi:hypothetical protein
VGRSVEYSRHLDFEAVNPMIIEKQSFGGSLAFVITSARADWVDVPDIAFRLWVDFRVSIHFAGRRLKHPTRFEQGEFEYIVGTHHAGLHRADWIPLVMTRRCRTGQIVDTVDISRDAERLADVMMVERKARMIEQWPNIAHRSREQVIDANDNVPALDQLIAKMRADESGASRNHCPKAATKGLG